MQQKTYILELRTDLVMMVFKFTDAIADRGNIRLTCKKWRNIGWMKNSFGLTNIVCAAASGTRQIELFKRVKEWIPIGAIHATHLLTAWNLQAVATLSGVGIRSLQYNGKGLNLELFPALEELVIHLPHPGVPSIVRHESLKKLCVRLSASFTQRCYLPKCNDVQVIGIECVSGRASFKLIMDKQPAQLERIVAQHVDLCVTNVRDCGIQETHIGDNATVRCLERVSGTQYQVHLLLSMTKTMTRLCPSQLGSDLHSLELINHVDVWLPRTLTCLRLNLRGSMVSQSIDLVNARVPGLQRLEIVTTDYINFAPLPPAMLYLSTLCLWSTGNIKMRAQSALREMFPKLRCLYSNCYFDLKEVDFDWSPTSFVVRIPPPFVNFILS